MFSRFFAPAAKRLMRMAPARARGRGFDLQRLPLEDLYAIQSALGSTRRGPRRLMPPPIAAIN